MSKKMIIIESKRENAKAWGCRNPLHDYNFYKTPEKTRDEAERQVALWQRIEPYTQFRIVVVDKNEYFYNGNI